MQNWALETGSGSDVWVRVQRIAVMVQSIPQCCIFKGGSIDNKVWRVIRCRFERAL
jgi:hypothetical protein